MCPSSSSSASSPSPASHRTPPRKRMACAQPPLRALFRANTSERTSTRAADAATLPASRAHQPVPPARRAASPLPAMPSSITGALLARMEGKGAHPVNIVRQWLRQDAGGFARITHDSDGTLLTRGRAIRRSRVASEARRSRAVPLTPIHPGSLLGVQPRLRKTARSVRRVDTSFNADTCPGRGGQKTSGA